MLEQCVSILFYPKGSKKEKSNERQIYLRITVDSERVELSTKTKWPADKWSKISGRAIGKTEQAKKLNAYLDSLQMKVLMVRQKLIDSEEDITAQKIKAILTGNSPDKKTILKVFEEHNSQMEALLGKEFAAGTLERYRTSLDHTKAFIKWKYNAEDIEIKKLNYDFISEYSFWLKSVRGCAHNTTVKYLANFKKIVLSCIKKGWLHRDPFIGFKLVKKEVPREILTKEELMRISEKDFGTGRLELVRDIFLFSCYTGLAYIDVKNLKRSQIIVGVDDQKWIFTKRKKTDSAVRIPVLPKALELMAKYEDNPKCINEEMVLPVLSNQKMNSYLKEIADLSGITKELTFHIARHTFATTVTLGNGVPIETVSKMLGHSSLKQTQHYAKIMDEKISEDMLALKTRLKEKGFS